MQIKDKLQKVIDEKNNDLSKLVWKGRNRLKDDNYVQNEVRMVDCTIEELKGFYDHCNTMLYNNNKFKPGRYKLKEELSKSINKCNTELAKRFLLDSGFPEFKMIPLLNRFEDDQTLFDLINEGDSIPYEFKDVTIGSLKEAMLDKLGIFNKKPLTITFIVKQGIWLTPEESEEFKGKNKMKQIKEALNFKPNSRIKLKVNPKGLSFEEMKSMLDLRSDKYSNYSNLQLELLRDKMLFILMKDVDRHISEWEERQQNILKVIEFKKES